MPCCGFRFRKHIPLPVGVTEFGPVMGSEADGVKSWLGVPYAAVPTGDLRFKPAQNPPTWTEPRMADTSFRCPEASGVGSEETCLQVNVFAPSNASNISSILVWIHGGGNDVASPVSGIFVLFRP